MRLAPLNNKVVFKKLFRDPNILQAFLYDLIGIRLDLRAEHIEMEKKFHPVIGNVDIAMDIFVDDPTNRVVIEMQREYYDYHYDRFLYYHQAATMDLVKSYHDYRLHRTVHTIVWLTQKIANPDYHHSLITTSFCSETPNGSRINIYPHRLYFLNPFYITNYTPAGVVDWLQLVVESILNPDHPQGVNLGRAEMVRAMDLIKDDGLTPQERAAMLDDIEFQRALQRRHSEGKDEQTIAIARNLLDVLDDEIISQKTELSTETDVCGSSSDFATTIIIIVQHSLFRLPVRHSSFIISIKLALFTILVYYSQSRGAFSLI